MFDSMIIGHVSMDTNIDHLGNSVSMAGGAVLYSSASAAALGHNVLAVTKLAPADMDKLAEFTLPVNRVVCLPSRRSTSIRNEYLTADKERRNCLCISQGDVFTINDVPETSAAVYHVAGLIYGDYEDGFIEAVSQRGKVAVDVQGFLRHADKTTGNMYFEDWADKKRLLPYVSFLKTDAAEAEIMTGLTDRKAAAEQLFDWGAKEVMITHNTDVIAYNGAEFASVPIRARNLSGRTGRGDTTFAAYICERKNSDLKTALLWATATVSLKMETPGVFKGTREDVAEYIAQFYPEYTK